MWEGAGVSIKSMSYEITKSGSFKITHPYEGLAPIEEYILIKNHINGIRKMIEIFNKHKDLSQ
jgi:hypothetical protein